jgi:hypothetical protein
MTKFTRLMENMLISRCFSFDLLITVASQLVSNTSRKLSIKTSQREDCRKPLCGERFTFKTSVQRRIVER